MKKIVFVISLILGGVFLLNNNVLANHSKPQIEEGIYEIYTGISDTKVLNVQDSSKENGANVNLYERENKNNQKFKVMQNADGTYTLMVVHSNKVLDVEAAGTTNGTNVWQYESNGTDAQKWYLEPCGDDYYYMVSKCNGLYLDIEAASARDGTNIQMYTGNKTNAQKFNFSKVENKQGKKVLEDGIYSIYSQVADNRVLQIPSNNIHNGANLKTTTLEDVANQKFLITYNNDGTYTMLVLHSKKALDVEAASGRNGTLVQQYSSNHTDAQKWILVEREDNTYSILSKCNGLALDIASGNKEIGAVVQTYRYNGTNAQKFIFKACKNEAKATTVENGTYRILSKVDKNKVFDVEGPTTANGGIIQIWENVKVIQQKFRIEQVEEGYYKIKANISNKVLTVESENPTEGSKITQQEDKNLETQKWSFKKYSESIYAIISKCGQLYIDLGNTKAENGQDLQLKSETDFENQQFILVNETPNEKIGQIEEGVYQITSKSNTVLDIYDGQFRNQANVQIFKNDRVQQQKFHIYKIPGTNYYKMIAIHSAKALDVQEGNANCGANINQYEPNGTDNQYWLLKECGDGYYNIISKANGLCLDVEAGNISHNGANVQLYYLNGTEAQKFKLVPINIINDNIYEIETKLDASKVIDIYGGINQDGVNAQIWAADNVEQQRFLLQALSTDTYRITARHSNRDLTVDTNNNNVYQSVYKGTKNQEWKIKEAGEGYYTLISKANDLALDVYAATAQNGQNVQVYPENNTNAQKFKFVTGFRKFYEEGTYGKTGLAMVRDARGSNLKYYKYGKGSKVLFANFSIHGFEDSYHRDGAELTYIAEEFKKYLDNHIEESIVNNWTIYVFPCLNPDGQNHGYTNNGPGRNTLFSAAPGNKGIDMNRNWSVGYKRETSNRNYNGTEPFQAYEALALREFMLNHQGITKNITIDIHGWLNETIGDNGLGVYYRNQFGLPTHIASYGSGYLINWARTLNNARSVLVELPEVSNHTQTVNRNYAQKFINATMQMLREN